MNINFLTGLTEPKTTVSSGYENIAKELVHRLCLPGKIMEEWSIKEHIRKMPLNKEKVNLIWKQK